MKGTFPQCPHIERWMNLPWPLSQILFMSVHLSWPHPLSKALSTSWDFRFQQLFCCCYCCFARQRFSVCSPDWPGICSAGQSWPRTHREILLLLPPDRSAEIKGVHRRAQLQHINLRGEQVKNIQNKGPLWHLIVFVWSICHTLISYLPNRETWSSPQWMGTGEKPCSRGQW